MFCKPNQTLTTLLSAPVAIAASAGHPRIESLSGNFCNAILVFKSKRATLTRRGRGGALRPYTVCLSQFSLCSHIDRWDNGLVSNIK